MVSIGEKHAGDAFYRYKMPGLKLRTEGRGNGIKTNLENNVEVAKALARPPDYLLKFYGFELGAMISSKNGAAIVHGQHDVTKLRQLLDKFIERFVQCAHCGNPETVIKVHKKREKVELRCKACGQSTEVDPTERLVGYILKNPPPEPPKPHRTHLS